MNSREEHLENVKKLNSDLVLKSVEYLKNQMIKYNKFDYLYKVAVNNPDWWIEHHFYGMMVIRNELRQNGFGEKEFGIDNLDDYAVGLVELALGITSLQ